jgi:hypothetical protein
LVPSSGKQVVKCEGGLEHKWTSRALAVERHQAGERLDQLRKAREKPPALADRFPESLQIRALKIAQTSMHDSQAVPGSSTPEIGAFQKQ